MRKRNKEPVGAKILRGLIYAGLVAMACGALWIVAVQSGNGTIIIWRQLGLGFVLTGYYTAYWLLGGGLAAITVGALLWKLIYGAKKPKKEK